MLENLNQWAKAIVLAVIIVSILEMLLPNNKTKKYVKMIMGIFILYNIISPFIKDKNILKFDEGDFNEEVMASSNTVEINQESMDRRLEELYIEEIEKDITKKVEKKGYIVKSCKVKAKITDKEENTGITSIVLKVEKDKNYKSEENNRNDNNNDNTSSEDENNNKFEDNFVKKIQDIKKITTKVDIDVKNSSNNKSNNNPESTDTNELTTVDIQNLKEFLMKEYEVNVKCLKIN